MNHAAKRRLGIGSGVDRVPFALWEKDRRSGQSKRHIASPSRGRAGVAPRLRVEPAAGAATSSPPWPGASVRESATAMNTAGRRRPALIGVPFDGMGRAVGQAGAPRALRAQDCRRCPPGPAVEPDLVVPGPVPQRAAGSGLLNERALLQMLGALHRRVHALLSAGRFPLVYGADCSCCSPRFPRCVTSLGRAGLVFLDGHEDATPMDLSPTGEAANMEIALLLGLTGERAPKPLRSRLPALTPAAIAMLGPRDRLYRQGAERPRR